MISPRNVEPKSHLSGVWYVSLGGLLLEVHGDPVNLLVVKQVRHLTRVQDTVDVLQETLLQGGDGVNTHPDANMILKPMFVRIGGMVIHLVKMIVEPTCLGPQIHFCHC